MSSAATSAALQPGLTTSSSYKIEAAKAEETPLSADVGEKYRAAGEVADEVVKALIAKCVPGALTHELCELGDKLITEAVKGKFKKINLSDKGIAFPTCISINNMIGNFAPLDAGVESNQDTKEGESALTATRAPNARVAGAHGGKGKGKSGKRKAKATANKATDNDGQDGEDNDNDDTAAGDVEAAAVSADVSAKETAQSSAVNELGTDTSSSSSKIESPFILRTGDLLSIDIGVHIDGYAALSGYTHVCGSETDEQALPERASDVLLAAFDAMEAAEKTLEIGVDNYAVTDAINAAYAAHDCRPVRGVLSHALKRNCLDDPNYIISNVNIPDEKVPTFKVSPGQVFALDVRVTTSANGIATKAPYATTLWARDPDNTAPLRTDAGRKFFKTHAERNCWPFHLRDEPDSRVRALGIRECSASFLIQGFQPCVDGDASALVAAFVATYIVTATGVRRISGLRELPSAVKKTVASTSPKQ